MCRDIWQTNPEVPLIRPLTSSRLPSPTRYACFESYSYILRLVWNLSSQHEEQLEDAFKKHMAVANTKEYHAVFFEDYGMHSLWPNTDVVGTHFLKLNKVSPDTYIQLALQLAYHKLHHETPATYESGIILFRLIISTPSAHTRKFKNGRTECVRTQSVEIQEWIAGMENQNTPSETKYLLMTVASNVHKKYAL